MLLVGDKLIFFSWISRSNRFLVKKRFHAEEKTNGESWLLTLRSTPPIRPFGTTPILQPTF